MEILTGFLLLLTSVVACILLYRHLRPLFPVKVNCWFCNHDTTVPYGNRNCWDCLNCEQYNGFTSDGDYNKPIPAQYTEDINHPIACDPGEFLSRSQYLCQNCQRNQLLKVKQLATFEPLNEATYDDEITFYRHHLENVYALCLSCDAVVKRELKKIDDTLETQRDFLERKDSVPFAQDWIEPELTVPFFRTVSLSQVVGILSTVITISCAMLVVACYCSRCIPQAFPLWLVEEISLLVDELSVCLCGPLVCVLSKLLLGKGRLFIWDAVDLLMWLGVLLLSMFCSVPHSVPLKMISVCFAVTLLCLELGLALIHRQPTNITFPVMKRLSLNGTVSSACSEAASEAVSSVSTSCRRRPISAFGDAGPSASPIIPTGTERAIKADGRNAFSGKMERNDRTQQKDDVEYLQKDLGAFLLGSQRGESAYNTGRSSPFSQNSFGPMTESAFGAGTPFPRPLISPAKLSVVSFSSSAGTETNVFANSSQNRSPSPFSSALSEPPTGKRDHYNIFLAQEARPLSMFSSSKANGSSLNSTSKLFPQYPPPKSSLLFSTLMDQTGFKDKACTETGLSLRELRPSYGSNMGTTWWRESASDIFCSRDDEAHTQENEVLKDSGAPSSVWGTAKHSDLKDTPVECDSTTPKLSELKIKSSTKKKKKTKLLAKKQRHMENDSTWNVFSDDDDDEEECDGRGSRMLPMNWSAASTRLLQSKDKDWSWVHWAAVAVVLISVATNFFLAWSVWSTR